MNYKDKQLLRQAYSSLLVISLLALVILFLSQYPRHKDQVVQVLGITTENK